MLKNLIGCRFGRLVVIERAENSKNGHIRWKCLCDCGKEKIIYSTSLVRGATRSCGCLHNEGNNTRHGMSRKRLHNVWCNMKQRCYSENVPAYKFYGGRGITVCDEWRGSFDNFRDWALENGYREDLTIDRIDVDGPYSPENCRWITIEDQQSNRRDNHQITYNGETHTLTQWEKITGIKQPTIRRRLKKGWSIEKALTTPVERGEKNGTNNETYHSHRD